MQEAEQIEETNPAKLVSEPGYSTGYMNLKVMPIVITGANPKLRIYPIRGFGWIDVPIFI